MAFAATASKRGAFADMDKPAINVAKELARLSALTIFELRGEWRRLHRMPPPMRLSRDLLVRGITYKFQERAYGGLSTATARKLEQAGANSLSRSAVTPAPPISLRPGTRLVREWRGVTHLVLIHADGIEWRGQRYRSLSVVARKITGARWSGPRLRCFRVRPKSELRAAVRARARGLPLSPQAEAVLGRPRQWLRWRRQPGALFGLVAIFNFGVIQRAEAVGLRIELASEPHFSDCAGLVSIPHKSEEKERRGAGSNIFLTGIRARIGKVGSGVERLAAFEPMFIARSTPDILREWISALPVGCIENCISFDQNCSAATNVRDCKLRRYRTIRGHLEDSLHFAHYNSWARGCYESTLCSIGGNFGRLQRPENKIALTSANYGQQPNQEKIEPHDISLAADRADDWSFAGTDAGDRHKPDHHYISRTPRRADDPKPDRPKPRHDAAGFFRPQFTRLKGTQPIRP